MPMQLKVRVSAARARASAIALAAPPFATLARIAERRADWPAVLAATDAELQRTLGRPTARAGASDYLIPGLIVIRALACSMATRWRRSFRPSGVDLSERRCANAFWAIASLAAWERS
jgi:hypothetical protein